MIRILVADDVPIEREILREYLSGFPAVCRVVAEAGNGLDAVRLAGTQPVDLALMDVRMPLLDGIEAARRLRAEGKPLKIITYTGYSGQGIREMAMAAGANAHFTKPFSLADLYQTICTLMGTDGA